VVGAPRLRLVWTLIGIVGTAGSCALPAGRPESEPPPVVEEPLDEATAALEQNDFESAATLLRPFVETCDAEAVRTRHRATLLLAAAELDVANPSGSPDAAATLAGLLIRDPDIPDEEAAIARSLYRLALDRGASPEKRPSDQGEYRECSSAGMASVVLLDRGPTPTTHDRLQALRDSLASRADTIGALHAAIARSDARVRELEAELERIRQLLKGRPPPP
jgi:hypothetical protein